MEKVSSFELLKSDLEFIETLNNKFLSVTTYLILFIFNNFQYFVWKIYHFYRFIRHALKNYITKIILEKLKISSIL